MKTRLRSDAAAPGFQSLIDFLVRFSFARGVQLKTVCPQHSKSDHRTARAALTRKIVTMLETAIKFAFKTTRFGLDDHP